MEPSILLSVTCVPGQLVHWSTISGKTFVGRLKEWDNGTAIIIINGKEKAVRCI